MLSSQSKQFAGMMQTVNKLIWLNTNASYVITE